MFVAHNPFLFLLAALSEKAAEIRKLKRTVQDKKRLLKIQDRELKGMTRELQSHDNLIAWYEKLLGFQMNTSVSLPSPGSEEEEIEE